MTYAVLDHHCRRDKGGHVSHRHSNLRVGTLRQVYGKSFAAGESADKTLYEILELPGSPVVCELHLAMLQQD